MWRSPRNGVFATLSVLTVLSWSAPGSALPLKRTEPSHLTSPPPFSILDDLERDSLPLDQSSQVILLRLEAPFEDVAERDQDATRACRARTLGQRNTNRYAVQFADRVVPGGPPRTLIDIDRVTSPDRIYLFLKASTTRCAVYSIPLN
ncbi:MAG: hypothetical protein NXI16_16280 [Alphaproteobacteria bacterium]|nr:hypothetical protein [Alphaproteobacteria bacterium]